MSKDTIIQIRKRGEGLFSSLQKGFYSNLTGLSRKSGTRDIFNSYREFGEPELFHSINEDITASEGDLNGLKLLRAFLADMFLMSRTSPLIDKILSLEASLVLKIGEKRVPYRSALFKILNEPKKQKRDEIESHRLEAQERLNPHLKEMRYVTGGASESLGFSSYLGLKEYTDETGAAALSDEAKRFIRDTEYVSKEMLDWFFIKHMEFPLEDASSGDVLYMLNSFELKGAFPDKDYTVCAAKVLDDSGLVNSSDVSAESGKRKGKALGGYLFPTAPPEEMSVSIYPAGGPLDYESYFGALGRALSYVFTERDDDFEYRYLRDPTQTQIFSELFKNLIFERKWLDRYIEFERGDDFYKLLFLRRLMQVRCEAGKLIYDAALYSAEGEDGMQNLYKEIMEQALHARVSGRDFLTIGDIRDPMLSASRFKACLVEPYLSKYLRETYDEQWWRVKEASSYLKNIWSEGGRCDSEDLAHRVGYEGAASKLRRMFEQELG